MPRVDPVFRSDLATHRAHRVPRRSLVLRSHAHSCPLVGYSQPSTIVGLLPRCTGSRTDQDNARVPRANSQTLEAFLTPLSIVSRKGDTYFSRLLNRVGIPRTNPTGVVPNAPNEPNHSPSVLGRSHVRCNTRNPETHPTRVALVDDLHSAGQQSRRGSSQREGTCAVREPVALCFANDGSALYIANRRTGSLSVIDPKAGKVVAEAELGQGLADVVALPTGNRLLVADQTGNALLVVDPHGESPRIVGRLGVSPDPVSVLAINDGGVVASRTSRRLTFFTLSETKPSVSRTVDLPFPPRNMVFLRTRNLLVVADAVGGGLAVVDPVRGKLLSARRLHGHNIRGLRTAPMVGPWSWRIRSWNVRRRRRAKTYISAC